MALPTIAEIDAAVPVAGTPSRTLTNAVLKNLIGGQPYIGPLRTIAAAQRMGNGWQAAPTGKRSFVWRDQNVLGGKPASFVPIFLNWTNSNSVDTWNTSDVTLTAVWIERVATGQIVPVTFRGSRSLTMPGGARVLRYLADEIPASVWTGTAISRGEVFAIAGKGAVPANSNNVMAARYKNTALSGSYFGFFDPATDVTGIDYTGTIVAPTGATTTQRGFSAIFAGRFYEQGRIAVGCLGDSIADGLLEQGAQTMSGQGPFEYINRIDTGIGYMPAVIPNINQTRATLMSALSGERYPTAALTSINWAMRASLMTELTDVVVDEFGSNNFQSASTGNPTDTAANVQVRAESAWAFLRSFKPGFPIIKTKLTPITNSSPVGGPTKASQTPAYDFVNAGPVDQWHTLLAAAVTAGKISAFINTRAPVADATDEHYWISNGSANYYVGETGTDPTPLTHPYAQTSILIAPVILAAVMSYEF